MSYVRTAYTLRINKNGKAGRRLDSVLYTPLNECDLCGLVSTPKRVHNRNDVYGWNCDDGDYTARSKCLLCTSCWNKVKPLVKAKTEAIEIKKLSAKLKREAAKWQK